MHEIIDGWRNFLIEAEKPTFDHYADKTEIEDGMATLYHVSTADFDELDPEIASKGPKGYTKQEYRSWSRPRVFFFTKKGQLDPGVGQIKGTGYVAQVPWDELYPVYKDPLKLSYPEMKEKYMEITGNDPYHPDTLNTFERVATLADQLYGYKGFIYPNSKDPDSIIATMWRKVPATKMDTQFYDNQ